MAAAILPTHAVSDARSSVRGFLQPGQRRVHMAKERPARRAQFLAVIAELDMSTVAVEVGLAGRNETLARSAAVSALAAEIIAEGVQLWTLDDIDPAERRRDRHDISNALAIAPEVVGTLRFDHLKSSADPLLWVADAVAWDVTHDRQLPNTRIIRLD